MYILQTDLVLALTFGDILAAYFDLRSQEAFEKVCTVDTHQECYLLRLCRSCVVEELFYERIWYVYLLKYNLNFIGSFVSIKKYEKY